MARWDVQVLGVDDGKPAATVVAAVARRLQAEAAQVERLIVHAPTTLVADLEETVARALVQELRGMGLRVKPRPSVAETEPSGPPSHMTAERTSAPVITDARATGPTISLPIPGTRKSPLDPELVAEPSATPPRADAARSPLEHLEASDTGAASGLELEDVPLRPASARSPRELSSPSSVTPPASTRPPATRPPASAEPARVGAAKLEENRPRVFWSALPAAFLVPLRGPVLPGLIAAPVFMGAAVLCSVLGTFMALVGVLVMTAAFVGVTLQVSHRCLWATAVGERMPASLPGDFLSEYAFPGITVVVVQGMLGGVFVWGGLRAIENGVPVVVVQGALVVYVLYNVIGFTLAAAGRSALGFFDFAKIFRIMIRAPFEVAAIAIIGAVIQGGAAAIAAAQFAAALSVGGIGTALLALAGSTLVVSGAAGYGTALSATMMGMLFWARPEVAA